MSKKQKRTWKAVILAAGLGSRINERTKEVPKAMLQIDGNYIFKMVVDSLVATGVQDIVFVVGYKGKMLRNLIEKELMGYPINLTFVTNTEYYRTNTMHSLWLCREFLDCPFIYFHGDLIFNTGMLKKFLATGFHNAILVDQGFPLDWEDAMKVITHHDEMKYMSKSITVNEMDGTAIGIYKFDDKGAKELFKVIEKLIEKGVFSSWVSEALNILAKTVTLHVEHNPGFPWVDVDNLKDLEFGEKILMEAKA